MKPSKNNTTGTKYFTNEKSLVQNKHDASNQNNLTYPHNGFQEQSYASAIKQTVRFPYASQIASNNNNLGIKKLSSQDSGESHGIRKEKESDEKTLKKTSTRPATTGEKEQKLTKKVAQKMIINEEEEYSENEKSGNQKLKKKKKDEDDEFSNDNYRKSKNKEEDMEGNKKKDKSKFQVEDEYENDKKNNKKRLLEDEDNNYEDKKKKKGSNVRIDIEFDSNKTKKQMTLEGYRQAFEQLDQKFNQKANLNTDKLEKENKALKKEIEDLRLQNQEISQTFETKLIEANEEKKKLEKQLENQKKGMKNEIGSSIYNERRMLNR